MDWEIKKKKTWEIIKMKEFRGIQKDINKRKGQDERGEKNIYDGRNKKNE